jgi:hypothetical protein
MIFNNWRQKQSLFLPFLAKTPIIRLAKPIIPNNYFKRQKREIISINSVVTVLFLSFPVDVNNMNRFPTTSFFND